MLIIIQEAKRVETPPEHASPMFPIDHTAHKRSGNSAPTKPESPSQANRSQSTSGPAPATSGRSIASARQPSQLVEPPSGTRQRRASSGLVALSIPSRAATEFEFGVPDHTRGSPLCPAAHTGGVCVFHGRRRESSRLKESLVVMLSEALE